MVKQVDFLNVMSYGLNGVWSKGVGLNSPLYDGPSDHSEHAKQRNFNAIAQFWIKQGKNFKTKKNSFIMIFFFLRHSSI